MKKSKVKIKSSSDFAKIPIMDKKNYLQEFAHIFDAKQIPPLAYASSGSSGQPTFWFRSDEQEKAGAAAHELIFRKIFNIKKDEPTLVVICFSMGLWVAGNFTAAACRGTARLGYKLTVATPGIEMSDIINTLRHLAPHYKNLILAGYPPFLADVARECAKQKVQLHNRIKIISAGDKFSEDFRQNLLREFGIKDYHRSLVSIYGSADAGILAHETPLTVFLRKQAVGDPALYGELFGQEKTLPALFQYDPEHIYFEEQNGELLFTAGTAVPLIRYNIHDLGRIIDFNEMKSILRGRKLLRQAKALGLLDWQWPFLVKTSRTDVAVTFYALNIYPEHIAAGISDKTIRGLLSGNFMAYSKAHGRGSEKLFIRLGLASHKNKLNRREMRAVHDAITRNLLSLNMEFRKLHSVIGEKALPRLLFVRSKTKKFIPEKIGGVLALAGKKPKVILSNA